MVEGTHRKLIDSCIDHVHEAIFGKKDEAMIELFKKSLVRVIEAMEKRDMTLKEFLKKMKETERDARLEKRWTDTSLALAMCVMYVKGMLDLVNYLIETSEKREAEGMHI